MNFNSGSQGVDEGVDIIDDERPERRKDGAPSEVESVRTAADRMK